MSLTLQPICFRCCHSFSCFSTLYPFHFLVSPFTFSVQLSLFTFSLFYTHIFADSSPSLWLMRVESASSCPLYLHGVVREFLPIFTCVIVACIFHFYLGCVHPNIYPLCHTYLSFIHHIWECVEYIYVYFLPRGYPIGYISILYLAQAFS